MSEHTPGPWRAIPLDNNLDAGWVIRNEEIDPETGALLHDPIVWEMGGIDTEANARLIAAAPDLLAACEALLDNATDSYCEWCQQHAPKNDDGYIIGKIAHKDDCPAVLARSAIARARGA